MLEPTSSHRLKRFDESAATCSSVWIAIVGSLQTSTQQATRPSALAATISSAGQKVHGGEPSPKQRAKSTPRHCACQPIDA